MLQPHPASLYHLSDNDSDGFTYALSVARDRAAARYNIGLKAEHELLDGPQ